MRLFPLLFCTLLSAAPALADSHRTIQVTGTGEVLAAPDMATLLLSVEAASPSAAEAMADMTIAANATLKALQDAGVDPKDIETTRLNLHSRPVAVEFRGDMVVMEDPETPRMFFSAETGVAVRLRDLDRIGDVITRVTAVGTNGFNGISFDVSDRAALQESARRLAVRSAIRNATLLAEEAGVTLGPILKISDEPIGQGGPGTFGIEVMEDRAMSAEGLGIGRGETRISDRAYVLFAIAGDG